MGKIINAVLGLKEKAKDAILRFPATILCILVSYCLIDIDRYTHIKIPNNLALVMVYSVLLAFISEMVLENLRQNSIRFRAICYSGLLLFLTAMYFVINAKSEKNAFVIFALSVLTFVAFKTEKRGLFEKSLVDLIKNSFLAGVFSSVFCVGVLTLLGSISILLVKVNSDLYTETLLVSYMILFPIMFLGSIPKIGQTVEYPKFIKNVLKFVVLPLSMAFTVVLYLYYVKVFVFKESIQDSTLAISVGFLITIIYTLILSTPFEEKIFAYSRKWMGYTLIPVVGVLIFGTIKNILQSGVRFEEYLYIVSAIWAIASIVLIMVKEGKYQFVNFCVLAVLAITSAFGPMSMYNVTTRSQHRILTSTLTKNKMLKNNKIVANEKLSNEDRKKIRDSIKYLDRKDLKMPSYYDKNNDVIKDILGNSYYYESDYIRYEVTQEVVNTSGYDYYIDSANYDKTITIEQGKIDYKFSSKETKMILDGEEILKLSNEDVRNEIYNRVKDKKSDEGYYKRVECTQDEMSYEYENDKIKVKFIYREMVFEDDTYSYGYNALLFSLK